MLGHCSSFFGLPYMCVSVVSFFLLVSLISSLCSLLMLCFLWLAMLTIYDRSGVYVLCSYATKGNAFWQFCACRGRRMDGGWYIQCCLTAYLSMVN